jgi:Ca2+-binding EF-hand superfamily protein
MARRLKTATSLASQAAKTTQATRDAAISRSNKATAAKDLPSFVSQTKMNLELQMVALQAQLALVSEIDGMKEDEKIDLLYSLLNRASGSIQPSTLKANLKKASASLSFAESINKALDSVESPDVEKMEPPQFEKFVQDIVASMDASVGDFAEFVVYQVLFKGFATTENASTAPAETEVTDAPYASKSILNDPRMQALFVLFDKDADSTVDFKEVAIGLYPLTNCMEASSKKAAGLLLMMDKDDQRVLSYEQFAKLIMAVVAAFCMTFDELADQLTLALTNGDEISEEAMAEILVAEEAYAEARGKQREENEREKTLDALSYSRTQKLFELWDANGDGDIDFQELICGLRKYQKSAMRTKNPTDVERDALMIMGHDKDNNHTLDREEFAYAMANYAEAVGTDLHELIDFMCVVSSQSDTSEYETAFLDMTGSSGRSSIFKQSLGTILDLNEGDSEEEEDDW